MIRYKYNGVEYPSLSILRQAVWEHEHKAYGKFSAQEQFAKAGIDVEFVEVPSPELPDSVIADRARQERDSLLSETDFYVTPDYPSTEEDLEEVKAYRQALRDVPNQEGFPRDIEWPIKPDVLR